MGVQLLDLLRDQTTALRYAPTPKRIRARIGGRTIADTRNALLVWEPRYVTPCYALPEEDIDASFSTSESTLTAAERARCEARPVLDPSVPFDFHTTPGEHLVAHIPGEPRTVLAYRPSDPDLGGRVILDFAGVDEWLEEDEQIAAHPRDPLHRIDVLPTSRHIRVYLDDELVAETNEARMLLETGLPPRYYLPRGALVAPVTETATHTWCAYKGRASYFAVGSRPDITWSYPDPRHDAEPVRGLIGVFNEFVDIEVDGVRDDRPVTPWSRQED
ncbi:MAG: hypothetical protein JWP66_1854 [Naasia sp.]|nr:hypothetical protein [Naasia sp.]